MDAGAEMLGYSGDITRTFPATGTISIFAVSIPKRIFVKSRRVLR
jgi:hypothetical protein